MTVADLLELPNDAYRYEVVEGVLVRVSGTRPKAGRVTRRLLHLLDPFVQAHALGTVTLPDEVYDFEHTGQPNTGLLPDLGFYYTWREPLVEDDQPYPFAPDLAVEVASPLHRPDALAAKARRYLRGATALIWVIWTESRAVDVWRIGDPYPSTTLTDRDFLDGEDVIPGFRCPSAAILD
jgi:Uma2 family endonuclease